MSGLSPFRLGSTFGDGHHKVASGLSGAVVIFICAVIARLDRAIQNPGFDI